LLPLFAHRGPFKAIPSLRTPRILHKNGLQLLPNQNKARGIQINRNFGDRPRRRQIVIAGTRGVAREKPTTFSGAVAQAPLYVEAPSLGFVDGTVGVCPGMIEGGILQWQATHRRRHPYLARGRFFEAAPPLPVARILRGKDLQIIGGRNRPRGDRIKENSGL
jgi:hypothetical protein